MFPTRLQTDICHAETAFDVVEREVVFGPDSPWFGSVNATFPMLRFVDVNDGEAGLAIINDGLREYQVTDDNDRTIAVTLMRAYQVSLTTVSKRWDVRPQMGLSQCPGDYEFRYLIYPHAGSWDTADVYANVEKIVAPLQPAQAGPHGGDLPKRHSFLQIEPANLVLSAVKRSESGQGLVVRVFNPTSQAIEGNLTFFKPIRTAHMINLEEKPGDKLATHGNTLSLSVDKKKIVTIEITF
jgi:alpha-mannosidase